MSPRSIPFLDEFIPSIQKGLKTCTARTKRYGEPGDILTSPAGPIKLTKIERVRLAIVRDQYWVREGAMNPAHFVRIWKRIHPRRGFKGNNLVWLHEFIFIGGVIRT